MASISTHMYDPRHPDYYYHQEFQRGMALQQMHRPQPDYFMKQVEEQQKRENAERAKEEQLKREQLLLLLGA